MVESIRTLHDGAPIEIFVHRCTDGEIFVSDAIAMDAPDRARAREYRAMERAIARHEKEVSRIAGAQLARMIGTVAIAGRAV